jgi:histidyl-tRNA synthetase
MDIIGEIDILAEVELICSMISCFIHLGLTEKNIEIRINNRKILMTILSIAGISEDHFTSICIIIDKIDKIGINDTKKLLESEHLLTPESIDIIIGAIMKKDCYQFLEFIKTITINNVPNGLVNVMNEIDTIFNLVRAYGYVDWLVFDPSVVRGLSYYTGVVFEAFDKLGPKNNSIYRAIAGGGRYDSLFTLYGSQRQIPCVGFGFGDCVIFDVLSKLKLIPDLKSTLDVLIIPFCEDLRNVSINLLSIIRSSGFTCDIILNKTKSISWSFSYADKRNASFVIFIAPEEWSRGKIRIKDLRKEFSSEKGEIIFFKDIVEELLARINNK